MPRTSPSHHHLVPSKLGVFLAKLSWSDVIINKVFKGEIQELLPYLFKAGARKRLAQGVAAGRGEA
jgi:hypothetical protein